MSESEEGNALEKNYGDHLCLKEGLRSLLEKERLFPHENAAIR